MHQAATDGTPEITGSKPCLLPSLLSFSTPATESKNGLGCVRQGPAFNPHPDRPEEEDVGKWLFIPGCKADVMFTVHQWSPHTTKPDEPSFHILHKNELNISHVKYKILKDKTRKRQRRKIFEIWSWEKEFLNFTQKVNI